MGGRGGVSVCWLGWGGKLVGGERKREMYICERFPVGFHFRGGVAPLFADDLGDFGVGEAGVSGDDGGLVVLAVEDECWVLSVNDRLTSWICMKRSCRLGLYDRWSSFCGNAYRFWAWEPWDLAGRGRYHSGILTGTSSLSRGVFLFPRSTPETKFALDPSVSR